MAIQTTLWKPDTCSCELYFDLDVNSADGQTLEATVQPTGDFSVTVVDPITNNNIPSLNSFVYVCPAHNGVTPNESFLAIKAEQEAKNGLERELVTLPNTYLVDAFDEFGEVSGKKLAPQHIFRWYFDKDRKLNWNIRKLDKLDERVVLDVANKKLAIAHELKDDLVYELDKKLNDIAENVVNVIHKNTGIKLVVSIDHLTKSVFFDTK